jgi:hypothetical protein
VVSLATSTMLRVSDSEFPGGQSSVGLDATGLERSAGLGRPMAAGDLKYCSLLYRAAHADNPVE